MVFRASALKPVAAAIGALLLYNCGDGNGGSPVGLQLDKSGPASVQPGEQVTYTISVQINGQESASNVVIEDATPEGLVWISNSGGCSSGFPCDYGFLAYDATINIQATYLVPADYSGPDPIVNEANVSGTILEEADQDDNYDSVTTSIDDGSVPTTTTSTSTTSSSTTSSSTTSSSTTSSTTTSSTTSSTTTSSTTTTTTTTPSLCLANNALHNKIYTEIYDCRQRFTGQPYFCSEEDSSDNIIFMHTGGGSYEGRDEPDTGFTYSGQLNCTTFVWSAVYPGEYTENGTWFFDISGANFSGTSTYTADDGTYQGNCLTNGALAPNIPPTPSVSPCN